ncbi:MAG: hypothetical protein KGI90_13350 [Burkholderiales bacterium]|nr:hypothetical protein [Burkholderiales bacterium]MDE2276872.1 hypothetical protein [Burkholderiales bacterium]
MPAVPETSTAPSTAPAAAAHAAPAPVAFPRLGRGRRLACSAAATGCSAALGAALLALFGQASSQPWLVPTPQLLQAQAQCEALPQVAQRSPCTQALVARTLAAGSRTERLAAR